MVEELLKKIEGMIEQYGMPYVRIVKGMWTVDDRDDALPGVAVSIEEGLNEGEYLLKFVTFICDVPLNAGPDFFREFLRMNFRVDHGTFAMESRSEMMFMDTLELANLDYNEFEATLNAMKRAPEAFSERYNINEFTMGEPQY